MYGHFAQLHHLARSYFFFWDAIGDANHVTPII